MESGVLTSQNGPFKYDAYLGFGLGDMRKVDQLRSQLEKRDVLCYPKYDLAQLQQSTKSSIVDGVARSVKCLLYVSESFINDAWYTFEVNQVLRKLERFSRDMVVVLKDPQLGDLPSKLKEHSTDITRAVHDLSTLEDPEFLDRLAAALKRELCPALAVMPKENIGYGAAFGFFYGYLRLVLPEFERRLEEETLTGKAELLPRTVRKMLIVMPESCFCPPQFTRLGLIEHTDKFVVRVAHRAGNKHRDYKSSLYKIIDQKTNEEYYFVAELATPLLTLYETYYFGLSGMTRDQLYTERDCFYFTLNAVLSHPQNRLCNGQYKLLFWDNDPEMKSPSPKTFYDFILPEIRKELDAAAVDKDKNACISQQYDSTTNRDVAADPDDITTYLPVPVKGPTPAAIYECLSQYDMSSVPRGQCLIINMMTFDKGPMQLSPRPGADRDVDMLKQLFEELKFTVQVHTDLTMEILEKLLLTESCRDHSEFDAFVCCLLTHGKLGVLYTSDAKPVRILDIAEYFDDIHCQSLRGKPKMFFVQACLTGSDSETSVNGSHAMDNDEPTEHHSQLETPPVNHPVNGWSPADELEASALDWDAHVTPTLAEANEMTWCEGKATLVPGRPDFLVSYATLPGTKAYRDREIGSLYVSELAKCLRQRVEIDRALKLVSRGVADELKKRDIEESMSRFQLPFHLTSGMEKLITL